MDQAVDGIESWCVADRIGSTSSDDSGIPESSTGVDTMYDHSRKDMTLFGSSLLPDQHAGTVPSLADIAELANTLLDDHGLTRQGWTFGWDRAKRRLGACNSTRRRITLSQPIFSIEANRPEARQTLLHEIAHALAGHNAGHGPKWKRIAVQIGARPQRCGSVVEPELPVVGTCGCGAIHSRVRKPATGSIYHCRRCRSVIRWSRRSR